MSRGYSSSDLTPYLLSGVQTGTELRNQYLPILWPMTYRLGVNKPEQNKTLFTLRPYSTAYEYMYNEHFILLF